jgi:transposase-like protein
MTERLSTDETFAERWRRSQSDVAQLREANSARTSDRQEVETLEVPASCPVCRSREVTTTSKAASVDAYWRCCACGEVWNVARHRAGSRYAREPFRR